MQPPKNGRYHRACPSSNARPWMHRAIASAPSEGRLGAWRPAVPVGKLVPRWQTCTPHQLIVDYAVKGLLLFLFPLFVPQFDDRGHVDRS